MSSYFTFFHWVRLVLIVFFALNKGVHPFITAFCIYSNYLYLFPSMAFLMDLLCFAEMTCTEWNWTTWQAKRCFTARYHSFKEIKFDILTRMYREFHLWLMCFRKGPGIPTRMTSECVG